MADGKEAVNKSELKRICQENQVKMMHLGKAVKEGKGFIASGIDILSSSNTRFHICQEAAVKSILSRGSIRERLQKWPFGFVLDPL